MHKSFKELTIKDAFMFAAVMADEEKCRQFLSMALEMDITRVRVITEKSMAYHSEYKGVRLDVWAVEENQKRRFNVEMQVLTNVNLMKRGRYYHAQIDMDALLAGENYRNLPDTYVIFICDFDYFKKKKYKYTFRNRCQEDMSIVSDDGNVTVFLSTRGENEDEVPTALVNFLKYVKNPDNPPEAVLEDAFVADIKEKVAAIKRDRNWEGRFMLLEELMEMERQEGQQKGEKRVNKLIELLIAAGRMEDIEKAVKDSSYQEQLFKEFNL